MSAKEFFEQVRQAERELYLIRRKQAHWEEVATRLSGVSEVHIRSTDMHSPTEMAGVNLADLDSQMQEEAQRYLEIERKARWVIDHIPQQRFREVLTLRYICCHSWKTISDEMEYQDEKSVYRVHGWALQAAEKILAIPPNTT